MATSIINWLAGFFIYEVFALSIGLVIFFSRSSALARLSWLAVILLTPFLGIIIYIFYGRLYPHAFSNRDNQIHREKYFQNYSASHKTNLISCLKHDQDNRLKIISQITSRNWYPLNSLQDMKLIFEGNQYIKDLFADLKQAQKSIYISYYTICDSEILDAMLPILAQKANQGVDVKILIDGGGSFLELPQSKRNQIKRLKIKLAIFFPAVKFMLSSRMNYRNHRKITIIDEEIAYTGGFNIADEYNNKSSRFGIWNDANVRFTGDYVKEFVVIFFQDYEFSTCINEVEPLVAPQIEYSSNQPEKILVSDDGPNNLSPVHLDAILFLLASAKKRIWMTAPYVIFNEEVMAVLKTKALNGVDVRIIVPGLPDKKTVYRIASQYCRRLANYNVKIFVYDRSFIHAKTILIDDDYCVIGTSNFDIRSFHQSFEVVTFIQSTVQNKILKTKLENDFKNCYLGLPNPKLTFFQFIFAWLWKILTPIY